MSIFRKSFLLIIMTAIAAGTFTSCVKDKFDAPPTDGPFPDITANTTIADLKAGYLGAITEITDDIIIEGVVIADDKSGNFYKTIVIQDATAGISIRVDRVNSFNDYPIGRKIYIKCKGLYMGAYRNLIQLGGGIDNSDPTDPSISPIADLLIDKFFVKGPTNQTVEPIDLSIAELTDQYQNMLIRLSGVQFSSADQGQPFADPIAKVTVNRLAQTCGGESIIVRTSGYSNFAADLTPTGSGTLVAVYNVFGTTKQLVIRNPSDLDMTGEPCVSEEFESGAAGTPIDLAGWTNFSEAGTKKWVFGGTSNKYADFNPFSSGQASNIGWLITPSVNISASKKTLSFKSYINFADTPFIQPGQVLVSTNFDGTNVLAATWTPLAATLATSNVWTSSGDVDLSAYIGQTIHVAFKASGSGTDTQRDAGFRIDAVSFK